MLACWPVCAGVGVVAVLVATYWTTQSGAYQAVPSLTRTALPAPQGLIRVEADATSTSTAEDVFAVCKLAPSQEGTSSLWSEWVSWKGQRIAASSNAESLPVYGVVLPDGAALCIANHAETEAAYKIGIRLTRGLYSVDQMVFETASSETPPQMKRLQSVILGETSILTKPGRLRPGMAAIYRFINRSQQTSDRFRQVRMRLEPLRFSRPAEFRRLMVPLRECGSHIGAISGGIQTSERYECLKHIHRALLTLSHAQALCRNFRNAERIPLGCADDLQMALDRLEVALTELSIGCLDLVPRVEATVLNPEQPNILRLTVSLTNAGPSTVSFIRLGVVGSKNALIRPSESAFFKQLGPGQTAKAIFAVQCKSTDELQDMSAHIVYMAARFPARVRMALAMREEKPR